MSVDAEAQAFEAIAAAYPHEAHAEWPERFWEFFQRMRPGVSRREMERLLDATGTHAPARSSGRRGS